MKNENKQINFYEVYNFYGKFVEFISASNIKEARQKASEKFGYSSFVKRCYNGGVRG